MYITAISPQKRKVNRVSVFIDGSFAFGMEQADAERCGLTEGAALTSEQLDTLLNEVLFTRARDTALRYLSYRQRTLRETYNRLREEDYPRGVIKRVLVLMVKLRYINDRQFAMDYIDSRARSHYGMYRIKRELALKGIKEEIINHAVSRAEFDGTGIILDFIRKSRGFDIEKSGADKLRRRGFSESDIRKAFTYLRACSESNLR